MPGSHLHPPHCCLLRRASDSAPHAFQLTGEGSGADCFTVAAALLLVQPQRSENMIDAQPWGSLAQRAARLIGPGGAAGEAAAELARVQREVHSYLAARLAHWPHAAAEQQQGGVEPLLWALCTREPRGGDADAPVLPEFRIELRPAGAGCGCGWAGAGAERELHRLELTGADVAASDSVLHSNPKLFDLQKALWGCAALHGHATPCPNAACRAPGGAQEPTALPQWLWVTLRREENAHHFGTPARLGAARVGPGGPLATAGQRLGSEAGPGQVTQCL